MTRRRRECSRQRDPLKQLVAAVDAAHASESVGENAGPQVSLEIATTKRGKPLPSCSISARNVLRRPLNSLVQERLLRLAAAIVRSSSDELPSRSLLSDLRRICVGAAQGAGGF
jgi:hypothetical protein